MHAALPFLGFSQSGDVAGLTMYRTRRRRRVIFLAGTRREPWSVGQQINWRNFGQASQLFSALPGTQKTDWERAAKAAGLRISGQNAYCYILRHQDLRWFRTLVRQSGVDLVVPVFSVGQAH